VGCEGDAYKIPQPTFGFEANRRIEILFFKVIMRGAAPERMKMGASGGSLDLPSASGNEAA
jgi:hypothetical protein